MDNRIKILILSVFAVFSVGFNFLIKGEVKAQSSSTVIDIDNLLFEHNTLRKENLLPELKYNPRLSTSAALKAYEMVIYDCWSHYCPDGKSPWDFFEESYYEYVVAGENLAEGFFESPELMDAWMNSKTHMDNILNREYTEVGFAIVDTDYQGKVDNKLVVVHFGKSFNQSTPSEKRIIITSPPNRSTLKNGVVSVNGVTEDFDLINVISNKTDLTEVRIVNGRFEAIKNLKNGKNFVYAKADSQNERILGLSNLAEYYVEGETVTVADSLEDSNVGIDQLYKNSLNLLVIIFLGGFLFVDLVIIIRKRQKRSSMNHYHLSILLILGFIIFAGGFGGEIINGIKI